MIVKGTRIRARFFQAKPFGTFSLAGVQMKTTGQFVEVVGTCHHFRVVFRTKSDAPDAKPGEPADFRERAARVGLPEDCFNRSFAVTDKGETHVYTILDIKTKNHTYPVICSRSAGARTPWNAASSSARASTASASASSSTVTARATTKGS